MKFRRRREVFWRCLDELRWLRRMERAGRKETGDEAYQ